MSWSNFSNDMEVAKDLDDLLAADEKYLHSIASVIAGFHQARLLDRNRYLVHQALWHQQQLINVGRRLERRFPGYGVDAQFKYC
ncbi:hypothetical protein Gotur_003413 [Gossypium turneri]